MQQIQGAESAFSAILSDGSVVTRGNPHRGGDSAAVQDQLRCVQQIRATDAAFAAILADGSVLHGVILSMVETALQSKISSGMYNRFRPHPLHSLPSWQLSYLGSK